MAIWIVDIVVKWSIFTSKPGGFLDSKQILSGLGADILVNMGIAKANGQLLEEAVADFEAALQVLEETEMLDTEMGARVFQDLSIAQDSGARGVLGLSDYQTFWTSLSGICWTFYLLFVGWCSSRTFTNPWAMGIEPLMMRMFTIWPTVTGMLRGYRDSLGG